MTGAIDIHALSGAYALDAVDDLERVAFERHLRECPSCAQEVRELSATVARLADESAATPPSALRDSVLAAVARTPQARPGGPGRTDKQSARSARTWRRFAAAAVAAGVVAAGAGFGTWTIADQRVRDARAAVTAERNRNRDIDRILAAPDVHMIAEAVPAGGRSNIAVAPSLDKAVVFLAGLPALDRDRVYQLWLIRDGNAGSLGALRPGQTETRQVIDNVQPADIFGLSIENAPRADQPSQVIKSLTLR